MRRSIALPLLAVALCVGCDPPQDYRAETELRADGTVARTVQQQNLEGTEGEWDGVRSAEVTDADDWMEPLAEVEGGGPTTIAWGEFSDALAVPHELPTAVGRSLPLTRDPATTDYGVLKVFEWSETVQPGVELVRLNDARLEFVELLAAEFGAHVAESLPPGADVEPLIAESTALGDALTVDLFRLTARLAEQVSGQNADDLDVDTFWNEAGPQYAALFAEYGFDLFDEDGELVSSEATSAQLERIAGDLIRSQVTLADGSPVSADWWRAVSKTGQAAQDGDPAAKAEIERLNDAVAVKLYGSVSGRQARFEPAYKKLWEGLIAYAINRRAFAYRQTMPGVLLETNGDVLSAGTGSSAEALFRFHSLETFPDGREMFARSALIDEGFQQKLLGGVPVRTREEIETFLTLVADPDAAAVWAECLEQKSVEPLRRRTDGAAGRLRELLLGESGRTAGDESAAGG